MGIDVNSIINDPKELTVPKNYSNYKDEIITELTQFYNDHKLFTNKTSFGKQEEWFINGNIKLFSDLLSDTVIKNVKYQLYHLITMHSKETYEREMDSFLEIFEEEVLPYIEGKSSEVPLDLTSSRRQPVC